MVTENTHLPEPVL